MTQDRLLAGYSCRGTIRRLEGGDEVLDATFTVANVVQADDSGVQLIEKSSRFVQPAEFNEKQTFELESGIRVELTVIRRD